MWHRRTLQPENAPSLPVKLTPPMTAMRLRPFRLAQWVAGTGQILPITVAAQQSSSNRTFHCDNRCNVACRTPGVLLRRGRQWSSIGVICAEPGHGSRLSNGLITDQVGCCTCA